MGANQNAEEVGESLAIGNTLNFEATERGTVEMSRRMKEGRERVFLRMTREDFSSTEANKLFFNEEELEENRKK